MTLIATVLTAPGISLGWAALAVAALMLLTWALSIRLRDVSIIDPVWGPAFAILALIAALIGTGCAGRRWLLLALTAIWGLRLGWHLTRRKLSDHEEDRRYGAMRAAHPSNFALWSLFWVFTVQGVLVLVVSLPVQVAAQAGGRLTAAIVPGLVVYLVGLGFESVGDAQLARFRADPANRGQVMDRGLWRYTRHPNYFGDACIWWGLWLVAAPAPGVWWTVVGPSVMTILLVRVSGKGLLEKDIGERRPAYADYVRRTSGFIPRPPRHDRPERDR
jgi:steroid 5-alpha reductase family enzyme